MSSFYSLISLFVEADMSPYGCGVQRIISMTAVTNLIVPILFYCMMPDFIRILANCAALYFN